MSLILRRNKRDKVVHEQIEEVIEKDTTTMTDPILTKIRVKFLIKPLGTKGPWYTDFCAFNKESINNLVT